MRSSLMMFVLVATVKALAPPHPNAEDDVHQAHQYMKELNQQEPRFMTQQKKQESHMQENRRHRRRRLDLELVNPQLCRGMTEEECAEMDRSFVESARHLSFIAQRTGYLRVLVVCIRFTNHVGKWLPDQEYLNDVFNSPIPIERAPVGSVKNFVEQNALGKLTVDFDIMPWLLTDNTELHYSFNISGVTRDFGRSANPVMDQLESMGVAWKEYDSDGNGKIDATILLHSGFQAEIGRVECWSGSTYEYRIWSHAISAPLNPWISPSTGISLDNYAVASANRGICGERGAYPGMITHEFLHNFGLRDLNDNSGEYIGNGLGHYSIMSNPYGINNRATSPSHLTPWEKISMGWLEPIEISSDGTYELRPSENTTDCFIIRKNYPLQEYLLIENRQPIGFDGDMWNGGILIWHIDDTKVRMRDRGYPGQPGWPGNNKHYQIANLQADGEYHIEMGTNLGDDGDFWRNGMEIGPWVEEMEATEGGIYPNTNSYRYGEIKKTGLRLYDFSPSGTVMSFTVEGLGPGEPTLPLPTYSPENSMGPSIAPYNKPSLPRPSSFPSSSMGPSFVPTEQPSHVEPTNLPSMSVEPLLLPSDLPSTFLSGPLLSPSELLSAVPTPSSPAQSPPVAPTPVSPAIVVLPPDIPTYVSEGCTLVSEPCDSHQNCCSQRCYHYGDGLQGFCLPTPDASKNALKITAGLRGGAGSK